MAKITTAKVAKAVDHGINVLGHGVNVLSAVAAALQVVQLLKGRAAPKE